MTTLQVGSEEHKVAFCDTFVKTHDPYDPAKLTWPALDPDSLGRLAGLPVWDEAVATERETALKVQTLAQVEPDPVLREAIGLQGFEEGRHSRMLELLTSHYGIPIEARPTPSPPKNAEWAFMRTGYGECFDSFFAFGLFAIARDSGFFPPALVEIFDPIMQEEARHILFFVNWVAYRRAHTPLPQQPLYAFRCGLAISLQILSRIRTAISIGSSESQDNFAMKSHASLGEISPRSFIELCLNENERRLAPYDPRLLRPRLAPTLARLVLMFLPRGKPPVSKHSAAPGLS